MGQILLKTQNSGTTLVSNTFIDEYLTDTNESQTKIYLYLLRCTGANMPVSVSILADKFNYSEKDVLRALLYLNKKGLLTIETNENQDIIGICVNDCSGAVIPSDRSAVISTQKEKENSNIQTSHFYSVDQMNAFKNDSQIKDTLFFAQTLLGRVLSVNDLNTLLYIHESLGFSNKLLEYLIEYCANGGKKHIAYIEKVALGWKEQGITTVDEAKAIGSTAGYQKEGYQVLRALGISRSLTSTDITMLRKWFEEYGFSLDIILESCARTLRTISQPSFSYADGILKNWHSHGVKTLSDITVLDESHEQEKSKTVSKQPQIYNSSANKYSAMVQGNIDYKELEKKLFNS